MLGWLELGLRVRVMFGAVLRIYLGLELVLILSCGFWNELTNHNHNSNH